MQLNAIQHCFFFLFSFLFYFDIYFIYISNAVPFPGFTSWLPISLLPLFYQIFSLFILQMLSHSLVSPPKIHYPLPLLPNLPTPIPGPGIPLYWDIEPSQDQGPHLPLMTDQAILCYICSQSRESHHVFSLIDGLVPGSSGVTGQFILYFLV